MSSLLVRRHDPPRHEPVVHGAQSAAQQATQQAEELDRGVRVHRQDFLEQRATDGEDSGGRTVGAGVGAAGVTGDVDKSAVVAALDY